MMDRLRWVDKKGKRIFIIDLSYMEDIDEMIQKADEARKMCMAQPEKSLLSVTYVKGSKFNKEVGAAMKKLAADTESTAKKAVVAGVEGLQKVIFHAVCRFSKRKFELYDSLEEAVDALSKVE